TGRIGMAAATRQSPIEGHQRRRGERGRPHAASRQGTRRQDHRRSSATETVTQPSWGAAVPTSIRLRVPPGFALRGTHRNLYEKIANRVRLHTLADGDGCELSGPHPPTQGGPC